MRKALLITLLVLLGAVTATAGPADPPTLPALPEPGQVVGISRFSVADIQKLPNPGNPPTGLIRLYADSTTGNLTCLTSTGGNCLTGGGGGGTVTGSGTTGFIPKWSGSTSLGNSLCDEGITVAGTLSCPEKTLFKVSGATGTADADFTFSSSTGSGSGPNLVKIVANDESSWFLNMKNLSAPAGNGIVFYVDNSGEAALQLDGDGGGDAQLDYVPDSLNGHTAGSVFLTAPGDIVFIAAHGHGAAGNLVPNADNLQTLGTSTFRWASINTAGAVTLGSGIFNGASSGSATVVAQATAGTPTLTLPTGTGTFAVTASSPLVLNATTGALTCATCVTSASALTNHALVIGSAGTQASKTIAAGTSGQVVVSQGASADPTTIDYPDVKFIPAANCNNATAGNGWSIGSGGTVTCRAGTNNLGGFVSITDTSSTFATFQVEIPEDWDSSSNPFIRFQLASTDATNNHTIIPSIQVACYKGDGTTTDDVAANAAHSLSTTTLNGNANRFWSGSNVQMNSTDVTGCVAGALMQVTVGRATDTATNAEFYGATITFPRLLTVQAN